MSERRPQNWTVPLRVRFRSPAEQSQEERTRLTSPLPYENGIPIELPVQMLPSNSSLPQHTRQIKELIRLGNILRADLSFSEVLRQITSSISACTGFRSAAINLIQEGTDELKAVAFTNTSEEGRQILSERRITVGQMFRVMHPRFCISQSYFIPHEHIASFTDIPKVVEMPLEHYQPGGWHPEDVLIVPLYSPRADVQTPDASNVSDGHTSTRYSEHSASARLLGFLSLDDPENNSIPTLESIEMIELFANQAAIAIDNARIFREREAEHTALENAIVALRHDLGLVQRGDLRVRLQSSHNKLRPVVDAINIMIDEISDILSDVQMVTNTVDEQARNVQRTSETLVRDTASQERQVQHISEIIDSMTSTMHQVSERAAQVSQVASEAKDVTLEGQNKVDRATDGMRQVRESAMQSARIMKRLGESGQEINDTVLAITDLTTRMNLLALNAAIEAVRAGEQGQGFGVIAQEIRTLAVHSAEAARKVASRIRTIQHETGTVSQSFEHNISRVVMQTELVTETGVALDAISVVTQQMADLVEGISNAAQHQAQGSQIVVRSIEEISRITTEVTSHMRCMQQAMIDLGEMTESLRSRLAVLRLSEK